MPEDDERRTRCESLCQHCGNESNRKENAQPQNLDSPEDRRCAGGHTTSYLLSEVNANLPLEAALAKESLQIFLRDAKLGHEEVLWLVAVAEKSSAPESVKGWRDLVANLTSYNQSFRRG